MSAAIFEAVLGNLAVAAMLSAIALGLSRWIHRPAIVHALWLLVLLKLLTPPLFTVPVRCLPAKSGVNVAGSTQKPERTVLSESSPALIVESASRPATRSVAASAASPSPSAPVPLRVGVAPSSTIESVRFPSWESLLLGIWLTGTLVWVGCVVLRTRKFARILQFASPAPVGIVEEVATAANKLALKRTPRVRVIPGGIAPMVWSLCRPTLYLPAGLLARLSLEQRQALVVHELAHIRRWDHLVRLIEFVALGVYWWCPLAWLARRELRRREEEACDADVLATLPASSYSYASAIVETIDFLAGAAPTPTLASGIGDAVSLRRRLVLILNSATPNRPSRALRFILALVGVAFLALCPKLVRLSATVHDLTSNMSTIPITPSSVPLILDEALIEPVHFLPSPVQLLAPNGNRIGAGNAAALSPGGSRLALAVGTTVSIWDLEAKRVLFELVGHTESINAIVFSRDGTRIATVSNDTTGMIWDATDGRHVHTLTGHARWVLCAAFSPDGRTLATGGYDRQIRLWDTVTGQARGSWSGHTGGVCSLAFSPGGQTVASGGADREVRLWDASRGVITRVLKKHQAAVRAVAFSPDGTRLASGSEDRTVQVWNPSDGREIGPPLPLPDYVTRLAFSSRGQVLFAGTSGGHVLNINPASGRAREYVGVEPGKSAAMPAHQDAVIALQIAIDGKSLLSVSQNGVARSWPSAGTPQTARLVFRSGHPMTALALSPDGTTLATAGQDGTIHLWDAATARALVSLPGHPGGVSALMFGAGNRLVSAGADEQVRFWDTASGQATSSVIQPTAELCIALSPDGLTLAIGGRKLSGITLVNLARSGKPHKIGEFAGEVATLAFTPKGDRICTGSADGWFRIWDTATGEEVVRGQAGAGSVDGISFNESGTIAAVVLNSDPRREIETDSGPFHEIVFLDTHDGSILDRPRPLAHPATITAAAFTPDGGLLTAAHDGNLYLWSLKTSAVLRTINGHVESVRGVVLVSDGSAVFSAGDRAAKKWPLEASGKK